MAISKSTPYVRYKKDFTSSLHLGTIHIESEYLDRTQKTTIESIHGMTWQNKVVNENKELNLLSDTQLELTELEKQYWNTGEKRVSVDEIHTLEEVEPNEDGTYTYTVNSMEGEYIEIYDGINNITSTSDGLDGQFEIVYDTTEEDINGNIALDSIVPQYEIADSGVGTVTNAKSTGLTLVNHITESSKEEVVAIERQEGQCFTIDNTVQGNIKSAILKGQTLVNYFKPLDDVNTSGSICGFQDGKIAFQFGDASSIWGNSYTAGNTRLTNSIKVSPNTKYFVKLILSKPIDGIVQFGNFKESEYSTSDTITLANNKTNIYQAIMTTGTDTDYIGVNLYHSVGEIVYGELLVIPHQDGMENWDIPYFEGMQSVKMPVLTTTGKNLFDAYKYEFNVSSSPNLKVEVLSSNSIRTYCTDKISWRSAYVVYQLKPHTWYNIRCEASGNGVKQIGINIPEYGNLYNPNTIECQESNNMLGKFLTDESGNVRLSFQGSGSESISYDNIYTNIQIEEISDKNLNATPYEPYKSNILTVNEEVHLRKVNDVYDELDLLTGELTTNIREYVYTGSPNEQWSKVDNVFEIPTDGLHEATFGSAKFAISNKFEVVNYGTWASDDGSQSNVMLVEADKIKIKTNYSTIDEFRNQLLDNPLFIQVKSKEKSIKTVDLTVQNQDGGTIPHIQTQQGITHVSTSSDGLVPTVEMSCSYDTIIKPNTTYTIKLDRPIVSDTMYLQVDLGGTMMMLDADVNAFTIKTPSTLSHSQLRLSGTGNTVKEIIVLEGNRVNDKIEYFEGMKNVENPILIVSNCQYVFGKGGRK